MPKMTESRVLHGMLALLAASALGACTPMPEESAGMNQNALDQAARALVRGEDSITAETLADLLVTGREPLSVIDIRARGDFDAGHIKDSLYSEPTALVSQAGRAVLDVGSRLVLVSDDGVQAAQIASLLRVAGVNAQALSGGYAAWRAGIDGQPSGAPADAEAAQAMAKRQAVACWLEGDYVAAAGLEVKTDAAATDPVPSGGYVPPLQPAEPESVPAADPLGLGLGLGLGEGVAPAAPQQQRKRLKVREGC